MILRATAALTAIALFLLSGCGDPERPLDGATDAGPGEGQMDGSVDRADAGDAAADDAGESDAGAMDSGVVDAGTIDAGATDAGEAGSGPVDSGPVDSGPVDSGPVDSGPVDSGVLDAGTDSGPADPCMPLPAGLTTWSQSDSASSGTPDTYILDVTPGDPFCASITGGGGGRWWVNVSNGTSSGVYCRDEPTCSIVVPEGQTALMVTAVTDDIGYYTLTVHYRPR